MEWICLILFRCFCICNCVCVCVLLYICCALACGFLWHGAKRLQRKQQQKSQYFKHLAWHLSHYFKCTTTATIWRKKKIMLVHNFWKIFSMSCKLNMYKYVYMHMRVCNFHSLALLLMLLSFMALLLHIKNEKGAQWNRYHFCTPSLLFIYLHTYFQLTTFAGWWRGAPISSCTNWICHTWREWFSPGRCCMATCRVACKYIWYTVFLFLLLFILVYV